MNWRDIWSNGSFWWECSGDWMWNFYFFYLYGFTNVSSNLCYLRKHLDIGYKDKIYHLYVFSNVSSNIHYLRISSDTELKGMVSHLYVFWKESLNIYYLWKVEDINCKCTFFTCIYSQFKLPLNKNACWHWLYEYTFSPLCIFKYLFKSLLS